MCVTFCSTPKLQLTGVCIDCILPGLLSTLPGAQVVERIAQRLGCYIFQATLPSTTQLASLLSNPSWPNYIGHKDPKAETTWRPNLQPCWLRDAPELKDFQKTSEFVGLGDSEGAIFVTFGGWIKHGA